MATIAVVSVLLVSSVVYGRVHDYSKESAAKGLLHLNFLYPGRRARQEHGFLKIEREDGGRTGSKIGHTILPVFIPVRYDLRRKGALERIATEDESVSPRLVMDEDFNIKFDNPNIMPLTKPLAFILNSGANSREGRNEENEKMMIPFPVLVEAREGTKDCRDDDVLEHRSNYDDNNDYHDNNENPQLYRKKIMPAYRYMKNGTTTYHKTNIPPVRDFFYPIRGKKYLETSNYNRGVPTGRTRDIYNTSSREHQSLDVYPSKIFADMYRTLPKQALESVESQEVEDYYHYDKRRHAEEVKEKPDHRRPYRGQSFSASTDLHWITNGNSTNMKNSNKDLKSFVIYDVTEPPETTTTVATSTTSSLNNDEDWGRKL